ncbi:MAG: RNA polymerase sigma factor [Solirubrobacteraceae bacterium]
MPERLDEELLRSRVADDFGRFYERHVGAGTAFVGGRVSDPELVFDLVSETFARALERRAHFDPERGVAVGWLLAITRNLLIDAARRRVVAADARARLAMAPVALDDEQLERVAERARADLASTLVGLPADQRDAVVRHFVLDQTYPEIAAELRCSEQVVRKRVSRG